MHDVRATLPVTDAQVELREKSAWQTPALTRSSAADAEKPGSGADLGNFS